MEECLECHPAGLLPSSLLGLDPSLLGLPSRLVGLRGGVPGRVNGELPSLAGAVRPAVAGMAPPASMVSTAARLCSHVANPASMGCEKLAVKSFEVATFCKK